MCSLGNKAIAAGFALLAAGVLASAAALLPRGSLAAFPVRIAFLGLAVAGVMIGYTWACDTCESHFHGRLDRLLSMGGPESSRRIPLDQE